MRTRFAGREIFSRVPFTVKTFIHCIQNHIGKMTFMETIARFYDVLLSNLKRFVCLELGTNEKYCEKTFQKKNGSTGRQI